MICYMLKEYFYKTILSVRFLITLLVVFLCLYALFHPAAVRFAEAGYEIGAVELLPCTLFSGSSIIFFGVFIFLAAAYPQWEGATERIPRLGKKRWIRQQFFYIALTAALYYLIWTFAMVLSGCPNNTWENEWSSFYRLSQDENMRTFFFDNMANVGCRFSSRLMKISSPFVVWGLTFLLNWFCAVFLGTVVIVFNTLFRRGSGTFIAFVIVAARAVFDGIDYIFNSKIIPIKGIDKLQNFVTRAEEYISPLHQTNLAVMAQHKARPLSQRVEIAVAYYIILIAAVLVFGRIRLRKADLSQEQ